MILINYSSTDMVFIGLVQHISQLFLFCNLSHVRLSYHSSSFCSPSSLVDRNSFSLVRC